MKILLVVLWIASVTPQITIIPVSQERVADPTAVVSTTLCEIAEHPDQFSGKLVSVRARYMGSSRDFWIEDFNRASCSAYTPVMAAYPGAIKPEPPFRFSQDGSSASFYEAIREGKEVEANFIGRIDVAYVWREQKKIAFGDAPGYGAKNRYGARLVI